MDDQSSINRANVFFWISFFVLLFLNWILFRPVLGPLIFGAILAGAFYPVFEKIIQTFLSFFDFIKLLFVKELNYENHVNHTILEKEVNLRYLLKRLPFSIRKLKAETFLINFKPSAVTFLSSGVDR